MRVVVSDPTRCRAAYMGVDCPGCLEQGNEVSGVCGRKDNPMSPDWLVFWPGRSGISRPTAAGEQMERHGRW